MQRFLKLKHSHCSLVCLVSVLLDAALVIFTTISLEIGSIVVTLVVFLFFFYYMNSGVRVMLSRGCHHVVRHIGDIGNTSIGDINR